jgi:signal transduction histidine kinase
MTRLPRTGRYRPVVVAGLSERVERYGSTALAGCLALGALIEDLISPDVTVGGDRYDRAPAVVVVVLCAAVALVALRRRIGVIGPLSALVVVGLAALPAPAWVLNSSFVYLLAMLVCGICGYLAVGRAEVLGLVVIWLVAGLAEWRNPERSVGNGLAVGAFMSIAWCAGLLARRPVSQARSAEERAIRFEHEQAAAARRAVTEERQRIARELHDIIAHSVSVMTMQVGAVRRLLRADQVRERESLLSVEQTGRDAMSEMRRLVGLLKDGETAAAYSPQPGIQSLDALFTTVREAGLPVDVTFEGERHDLSPGVDLTAFRVVQEALTNALKHAGPARAWVRVCWTAEPGPAASS